jgi:long-chain acyl-CoA synthetase
MGERDMKLTMGLKQAALHHPTRAATVFENRTRSYEQVLDRVARLASGLNALGAMPGERIAILALNSDAYYEAYYAILWAGCLAVPCNTRWAPAEHRAALEDCEPCLLLVDQHFVPLLDQLPAAFRERTVFMGEARGRFNAEELIERSPPAEDNCGGDEMPAAIFYTGGTTGAAKGVVLSHDNLIVNFFAGAALEPYPQASVFLHVAPMFHLADATMLLGLTWLAATHVILARFEPAQVIDTIQRYGANTLLLVPTMIGMIDQYLRGAPQTLSEVRRLTYGASPISESLMKRALQIFPHARIIQAYGQTELSPVATLLLHEHHVGEAPHGAKLRSAGRAIPGVELRIVDAELNTLPSGDVGEILVKGPNVMQGYWKKPELTAATILNGWVRTGDAGYLDAEGFLFLVDRVKDMIVSGGENVYSAEVENALAQHPAILECAVIGIPDDRWGERVHAVLRFRPGSSATEEELTEHCNKLIANYKRPRSFDFRQEPLPLSGAGKILKVDLRKAHWGNTGRAVN